MNTMNTRETAKAIEARLRAEGIPATVRYRNHGSTRSRITINLNTCGQAITEPEPNHPGYTQWTPWARQRINRAGEIAETFNERGGSALDDSSWSRFAVDIGFEP